MLTHTDPIEAVLQPELLPGERLLWSGQPGSTWLPRLRELLTVPIGLVWGAMALGVTYGILARRPENAGFLIFVAPFGLAALFMVLWPFVGTAWQRRRTYYGLTTQRLLIVTTTWRRHVRALALRTLSEVQVSVGGRGRGTLTFGAPGQMFGALPSGFPVATRFGPATFENIADPRDVYQQIHAAQTRLLEAGAAAS